MDRGPSSPSILDSALEVFRVSIEGLKTPTSLDSDSFKIWVTGDQTSYTKQVYPT